MFSSKTAALAAALTAAPLYAGDLFSPVVYEGHTYFLTEMQTDWTVAQADAEAAGGHLVVINDAAEQQFIEDTFLVGDFMDEPLWIGLTDVEEEGNFEWVNGDPLTYTNWKSGEPNNLNDYEHYGVMNWHFVVYDEPDWFGQWNDSRDGGTAIGPFYGLIELPIPSPGAAALFGVAALGAARRRRG